MGNVYEIEFVLDNGAVYLQSKAVVIANNEDEATQKLKDYVNHMDYETYCKSVNNICKTDKDVFVWR